MRSQQIFTNNLRKNAWGEVRKPVKKIEVEEESKSKLPDGVEPIIERVILKKRKKRLPGENLVKKYTNPDNKSNIISSLQTMEDTYVTDGDQEGGCGETKCQSGDGLILAGAGLQLAGAGGLGAVHNVLAITLRGLASSLVNSFFRGFKGAPRSQVTRAKHEITRQLANSFMNVPVPELKSHVKLYAEEIASQAVQTLNLESAQATDQVYKKVHQGLKRVFSKGMKSGMQEGAGLFKSLRGLANRAAKGLQPMASQLFDQCAADPAACIGKARSIAGRASRAYTSAKAGDLSGVQSLISDGSQMVGSGRLSEGLKKLPGRAIKGVLNQTSKLASKCIKDPVQCAEAIATGIAIL